MQRATLRLNTGGHFILRLEIPTYEGGLDKGGHTRASLYVALIAVHFYSCASPKEPNSLEGSTGQTYEQIPGNTYRLASNDEASPLDLENSQMYEKIQFDTDDQTLVALAGLSEVVSEHHLSGKFFAYYNQRKSNSAGLELTKSSGMPSPRGSPTTPSLSDSSTSSHSSHSSLPSITQSRPGASPASRKPTGEFQESWRADAGAHAGAGDPNAARRVRTTAERAAEVARAETEARMNPSIPPTGHGLKASRNAGSESPGAPERQRETEKRAKRVIIVETRRAAAKIAEDNYKEAEASLAVATRKVKALTSTWGPENLETKKAVEGQAAAAAAVANAKQTVMDTRAAAIESDTGLMLPALLLPGKRT